MKLAGVVALAAVAAVASFATACSKPSDDGSAPPVALGFNPTNSPPPPPAVTPSATQAAPAFTSYFDRDAGTTQPNAASAGTAGNAAGQRAIDPDEAPQNALRARLNACFPLAKLASGTSRTVAVTFTVIATGRVSRYDISGAESTDGAFYDCVHGIADSASFPERSTTVVPGGPAPVPEVRTVVVTAAATAA